MGAKISEAENLLQILRIDEVMPNIFVAFPPSAGLVSKTQFWGDPAWSKMNDQHHEGSSLNVHWD